MRRRLAVAAVVLVLVFGAAVFGFAGRMGDSSTERKDSLRTVLEVVALVKTNYVDDVGVSTLLSNYARRGSISGMLETSLKDPYTRYLVPAAYKEMKIDNAGEFGGIGVYLGMGKDNELLVIAPIDGTPAARAKMKAGDHIVAIDGRSSLKLSVDEAASLMRGPKGTTVTVVVERGKEKERLEFRLVRDVIKVPSVRSEMLEDKVGYLRIASFTATTADDFEENLKKLETAGLKGLILDLRFNPGGLLSSAIDVLNKLIGEGPLVHVVGRASAKQSFYARPEKIHPNYPMVVLINGGSASAAEIVAGGLQDTHRAVVLGVKSFGKGSVQTIYPLRDGSALSLTTQKWLTAGGHSISKKGILPDVVVKNPGDDEMEAELEKLRAEQNSKQPPAVKTSGKAEVKPAAQPETKREGKEPATPPEFHDLQLEKARDFVKQQFGSVAQPNAA